MSIESSFPTATTVLIVGAGPVGLLLANELQRRNVPHVLVDRSNARSYFCKALGVTARTREILEGLGLAREACVRGVMLRGIRLFENGLEKQRQDFDFTGLPYGALLLPQFETEKILEDGLHRSGGAIYRGWSFTSFTEREGGVQVELSNAAGEKHLIFSRWLVGCDGSHSSVRHALNLGFEGDQLPQSFVLCDVEADWDLPRGYQYRFNLQHEGQPPRSLAAMPIYGSSRRYRLSTVLADVAQSSHGETDERKPTLEEFADLARPLLPAGTSLSQLRWSSIYRVSHRIAPAYRIGQVFLAGDAAYIHPPVGGLGMNTGLQDAHNLAWKLALAVKGVASETLLESYDAERRPVGLDVVENTSMAMRNVLANQVVTPSMRETQLLIAYADSPIVASGTSSDERPTSGDRAPDAHGLHKESIGHGLRLAEWIG